MNADVGAGVDAGVVVGVLELVASESLFQFVHWPSVKMVLRQFCEQFQTLQASSALLRQLAMELAAPLRPLPTSVV